MDAIPGIREFYQLNSRKRKDIDGLNKNIICEYFHSIERFGTHFYLAISTANSNRKNGSEKAFVPHKTDCLRKIFLAGGITYRIS